MQKTEKKLTISIQTNSSAFVAPKFLKFVPASVFDVVAVQLPGRGNRKNEKACISVVDLVKELVVVFEKFLETDSRQYCMFGHSMGSLVMFVLCKELIARNEKLGKNNGLPLHLFASSRIAPQCKTPEYHKRTRDEMMMVLKWMGGTPEEVLKDPQMLETLIPLVFADFTLNETYMVENQKDAREASIGGAFEDALDIPITVVKGTQDNSDITFELLQGWKRHTKNKFMFAENRGGHFHCMENTSGLFEIVLKSMGICSADLPQQQQANE